MITVKHGLLLSGPITGKSVFQLPGIGDAYGSRLQAAGYKTAQDVLNKYLALDRNSHSFTTWLNDVCGANSRWANLCCTALRDYSEISHKFSSEMKYLKSADFDAAILTHKAKVIEELEKQFMHQRELHQKLKNDYDDLMKKNANLNQQKQSHKGKIEQLQSQVMKRRKLFRMLAQKYERVVNKNKKLQQQKQENNGKMYSQMGTNILLQKQLMQFREGYEQLQQNYDDLSNQHKELKIHFNKVSMQLAILKLSSSVKKPNTFSHIIPIIPNISRSFITNFLFTCFYFILFNFVLTLWQQNFYYPQIE